MKKKATKRSAKASNRQSTLNFPTSSEADVVAESATAVTSTKSGTKKRRKGTADFADDADKTNKSPCDSSAISAQSAVKNPRAEFDHELARLPSGWRWMKAHEVGAINLGRQRSPKHRSAEFPTKYLRAANITEKGLDLSDVLEMDFKPTERERYQLKAGDILIAEASGSAAQVGKPAIWNDELPLCCFQNTVIRLRPTATNSKYLLWLFTHFYRNGVFALVAGGVGINHLSASKFSELYLPIAPAAEQHRIVAEIEKQFTRLDAGVAALKRVQANLKRYRAAVLKAACEGRLVPTDDEWKKVPLKELIGKISQGWSPKCDLTRDALPDEWAIITTTAVQSMRYIDNQGETTAIDVQAAPTHRNPCRGFFDDAERPTQTRWGCLSCSFHTLTLNGLRYGLQFPLP